MKKYLLCVLVVMSLFSCTLESGHDQTTEEEVSEARTAKDYEVTLLFEYDSVKVYRFVDMDTGRYVYFSNANGSTQYQYRIKTHNRVSNLKKVESLNTKQ